MGDRKMKPGFASTVPDEEIINVLAGLDIFFKNQLKKELNQVWDQAVEELRSIGQGIAKHTLYEKVRQNRNHILTKIQYLKGIIIDSSESEQVSSDEEEHLLSSDDLDYGLNAYKISNPNNCEPLEFLITIKEKQWEKMKPSLRHYKNKKSCIRLKKGWADIVTETIYRSIKPVITCPYSLKENYVYSKKHSDTFFYFHGFCSDKNCHVSINGQCSNNFDVNSNEIEIKISTFDARKIPHSRKRKLQGENAIEFGKILKNIKAVQFGKERATEIVDFGGLEPPDLHRSGSHRRLRQKAVDLKIGFEGPKDVLDSLKHFKRIGNHGIRLIDDYHFSVIYNLDEQIHLWNEIASDEWSTIIMDSTGTFCTSAIIECRKSGYIMLYQMVAKSVRYKKRTPISQMLSERQDVNKIVLWLKSTFENSPMPREVVTDGSSALANASCLMFNKRSYKDYLNTCFKILKYNNFEDAVDLRCYIRQDRAHLINAITKWKCFKNKPKKTKDFYSRIIAFCIEEKNIKIIEDVAFSIFVVSNSEVITKHSVCEDQYNWIIQKIETFNRDPLEILNDTSRNFENSVENNIEDNIKEDFLEKNLIRTFFIDLYNKSKKNFEKKPMNYSPSTPYNEFFCPDIKENLLYTFSQYPCWSNAMLDFFKCPNTAASSADVEEYFKDIRVSINTIRKPNKFLLSHVQDIRGEILKTSAGINLLKLQKYSDNPDIQSSLILTNLTKKNKNIIGINNYETKGLKGKRNYSMRKRAAYIPRYDLRKNILNGNHCPDGIFLPNYGVIFFLSTCAFDAVFELMVDTYEQYDIFKNFVRLNSLNNEFLKTIRDYVDSNFSEEDFYRNRGEILNKCRKIHDRIDNNQIFCNNHIIDLINAILGNCNILIQIEECKLENCYQAEKINTINQVIEVIDPVHFEILRNQGFVEMVKSCLSFDRTSEGICPQCFQLSVETFTKVNDTLILISVEESFAQGSICLDDIPTNIKIENNAYQLAGLIEYQTRAGHFVSHSYSYSTKEWIKRCDLLRSKIPFSYKKNTGLFNVKDDSIVSFLLFVRI